MTLRIETAELSLAALDRSEADSVAAFAGPARPLRGLAGLLDWRLCAGLSRALSAGTFVPESGEVLLLPAAGRIPARRIFCFGLPDDSEAAALAAVAHAGEVLGKAGCRSLVAALPSDRPGEALLRAWIEAGLRHGPGRQVLLGDARALARDLAAAARRSPGEVEVVPQSRAEPGERDVRLPARNPVVR